MNVKHWIMLQNNFHSGLFFHDALPGPVCGFFSSMYITYIVFQLHQNVSSVQWKHILCVIVTFRGSGEIRLLALWETIFIFPRVSSGVMARFLWTTTDWQVGKCCSSSFRRWMNIFSSQADVIRLAMDLLPSGYLFDSISISGTQANPPLN